MGVSGILSSSLSAAAGGVGRAWEVVKAQPLSTVWATATVGLSVKNAVRDDHRVGTEDLKRDCLIVSSAWLTLRVVDSWWLANPISTTLLGYEVFRLLDNCRKAPLKGGESKTWDHIGWPDLAVLLAAGAFRFGAPKLFTNPSLAWVC